MKMIKLLIILCVMTIACARERPKANLVFDKAYETPQGFAMEFVSDRNFDALYADNKYLNVIRKSLTCSLTSDANFDLEHRLQYVFKGAVQPIEQNQRKRGVLYRYLSIGDFYENTSSSNSTLLRGESLQRLLDNTIFIQCKVIMTIYPLSPYFSNVMLVPADNLKFATLR